MTSLRETQKAFMQALFGKSPERFEALIHDGEFPAKNLTQVYRNNLFISLSEALAAVYPIVQKLVGEPFFGYLADAYIHQHPSTSGDIHDFGGMLPNFISSFPACDGLPYLADVAALEWAWHEVFHEKADPPLDLSRLAKVPPDETPRLRFLCQTASRLLHSRFPVLDIWLANQRDSKEKIDLDSGETWLAVVQFDLEPVCVALAEEEYEFLQFITDGLSLDEAARRITTKVPDFDLDLSETLYRFVQQRLIVNFE